MRDGKFQCNNRADEEPFEAGVGNSTSPFLDPEQFLIACNDTYGNPGFQCSEHSAGCLGRYQWCNPTFSYSCHELKGKTSTGKTIDPLLCSNQSYWDTQRCFSNDYYVRCIGDIPGQCTMKDSEYCIDGSSDIKLAEDDDCGDVLMCTARDGKWAGRKICLEEKYRCDNYVQCTEAEDEYNCEARYCEKGIFPKNDRYVCKSPSVPLKTKKNMTGK